MDYIDKILEYAIKQGSENIITIVFLYLFLFKPLLARLTAVSGYIRRFLAIQNSHAKSEKALVSAIQELSQNIQERRSRHFLEDSQ